MYDIVSRLFFRTRQLIHAPQPPCPRRDPGLTPQGGAWGGVDAAAISPRSQDNNVYDKVHIGHVTYHTHVFWKAFRFDCCTNLFDCPVTSTYVIPRNCFLPGTLVDVCFLGFVFFAMWPLAPDVRSCVVLLSGFWDILCCLCSFLVFFPEFSGGCRSFSAKQGFLISTIVLYIWYKHKHEAIFYFLHPCFRYCFGITSTHLFVDSTRICTYTRTWL